jgi:ribose 5-phosphate isomerase A
MDPKESAGRAAAARVEPGMTLGLGTGSTVRWLIEELATRHSQGLSFNVVPTSRQTAELASEHNIPITDINEIEKLPLTIDGADEIDPSGHLIKGGGGALLREKIVAAASDYLLIIADEKKLVPALGRFPLPIEVIPFGNRQVQDQLLWSGLFAQVTLRQAGEGPFITDQGHYILDCKLQWPLSNPYQLESQLRSITGIVETGLFIEMADEALIGHADGRIEHIFF